MKLDQTRNAASTLANVLKLALALSLSSMSAALAHVPDDIDQDDGALGSEKPHIPEPMVFDLVRPLGTTRRELEVNTLAQYAIARHVEWAPEIEYAVRDGLALELELPWEDTTVREYKIAAQGTLARGLNHHFIHGWQVIGRYRREDAAYAGDALYIAGYRLNERWATLNMLGLRTNDIARRRTLSGLVNLNAFYDLKEDLVAGLEINNEFNARRWHYAITPQLHLGFNEHFTLQLGAGPARQHDRRTQWVVSGRLIFAF
jgi:hypothetical protein